MKALEFDHNIFFEKLIIFNIKNIGALMTKIEEA
ncbi:MAG: hypothetical protein ACJAS1_003809 [Oleiphilaceae bacterium]